VRGWKLLSSTYKRTVDIPENVVLFPKRTVPWGLSIRATPNQLADLPLHHLCDLVERPAAVLRKPEDLQPVADRGQRVAKFVCEQGDELVLAPVEG
jgi:hypothetical protein